MNGTIQYGIDLGTTNSAIARFDGSEIRIFKNRDQMEVTPSVVQIDKTSRVIVGRRAYNSIMADPDNVAAEFKRWMGQSDTKAFAASGRSMTAEELSAEVLKALLDDVARQTGERVPAVVITVPAAFGQLQCEATSRAAKLAGLQEVILIQEPVAAAIACGMRTESHEKRFLVYDLGGGTFDVAVVSTRDGQLSVLDHCGNNLLGGKDIDRTIVRKLLLPRLRESYAIAADASQRRLMGALQRKAEEAKIDLSFSESAIVSLFDVGTDDTGREIEAEITISRAELNAIIEPLLAETIDLATQAIAGARLGKEDISSVVLVGGPTQMPAVRDALSAAFNCPLDFSIDPMTVVARGAAIYASTCPMSVVAAETTTEAGAVKLSLAFEPVWPDTTSLVAGRAEAQGGAVPTEAFISGASGLWNSGWIPLRDGYFETMVHIPEGRTETFSIELRSATGAGVPCRPNTFSIRHGLTLSEPPLPHSIGAEILGPEGEPEMDVIFPRSTPLPAQKVVTYKASRTLRHGQLSDVIAIKLWEGEYPDPYSNTFVGALAISAERLSRPIREGADIELTISIDASRRMEVHAFVPSIGEHFQERVYVARDNDPNLMAKVAVLDEDITEGRVALDKLASMARDADRFELVTMARDLGNQLDDLWLAFDEFRAGGMSDPDDARKIHQRYTTIRGKMALLRRKIAPQSPFDRALEGLREERSNAMYTVAAAGSQIDRKEIEELYQESERQIERRDIEALGRLSIAFRRIHSRVAFSSPSFWESWYQELSSPYAQFTDRAEASRHLQSAHAAYGSGNLDALRDSIRRLWVLMPDTEKDREEKQTSDSGIRRGVRS